MKWVALFFAIKTLWFFFGIQAIKYHHQMTGVEVKSEPIRELMIAFLIPDLTWFIALVIMLFVLTVSSLMKDEDPIKDSSDKF